VGGVCRGRGWPDEWAGRAGWSSVLVVREGLWGQVGGGGGGGDWTCLAGQILLYLQVLPEPQCVQHPLYLHHRPCGTLCSMVAKMFAHCCSRR